jgi:hypothetical protein
MSYTTKTLLKSYFETGDIPTQTEFEDLITSLMHSQGEIPTSIDFASTITPNCQDGNYRKITLTGNVVLNSPTNATEGMRWELLITCDGTNRILTMHNDIKIPSESSIAWPKTLTASKKYIVLLRHDGTNWLLASMVGGY